MDKSVNSAAFPLPDNRLHPLPRRQAFSRIPARSLSACGFFARRSITPCSGHACQSAQRTSHNYTGHRHPPSYRICLCVHDLTPFALHLRLAAFHNKHPCSGTGNGRSRRQRHDLSANIAPVSDTIRQHTGTAQPAMFPRIAPFRPAQRRHARPRCHFPACRTVRPPSRTKPGATRFLSGTVLLPVRHGERASSFRMRTLHGIPVNG